MEQPKERLVISNFAGIKQLDLEARPFTVLIGPQSVGKSVTAKLLYFFQSIPRFLAEHAFKEAKSSPEEAIIEKFKTFFLTSAPTEIAHALTYQQASAEVRLDCAAGTDAWKIFLPDALEKAFATLCDRLATPRSIGLLGNEATFHTSRAQVEYANAVYDVLPLSVAGSHFIPAGRSFYAQVQTSMASFFQTASLDSFVTEFGVYLADLRAHMNAKSSEQLDAAGTSARELSARLLGGEYVRTNNEDFINTKDGRRLPASIWSSGQQEAQPLTFVLGNHCRRPIPGGPLFIEEPEAHLFPTAQRTMTEFIALAFNTHQPDSRMFVTTHSPYILVTLNNLLLAGQLYTDTLPAKVRQRLAKTVSSDRALRHGDVAAYYMDQDGCRSIMDRKTGLIGASAIDRVSTALNKTFETLLDIQYRA